MSMIIQAGHSSSMSKYLMNEMYLRGLKSPIKSYTYGLTADEITQMLNKVSINRPQESESIRLMETLTLDLALSNLEQDNWGWAFSQNPDLLKYWKDSSSKFILVFDHPKYIFADVDLETLTTKALDKALSEWLDYHRKLLGFYKSNQSSSLLVEGTAAIRDFRLMKSMVETLDEGLRLKSGWQVIEERSFDKKCGDFDRTVEVLADELFKQNNNIVQTFNGLLDEASIKCSAPIYTSKPPLKTDLIKALQTHSRISSEGYNQLTDAYKKIQAELKKTEDNKQKLDKLLIAKDEELNNLSNLLTKKEKAIADAEARIKDFCKQNVPSQPNFKTLYNNEQRLEQLNNKLLFQLAEAYQTIDTLYNINHDKLLEQNNETISESSAFFKSDYSHNLNSTSELLSNEIKQASLKQNLEHYNEPLEVTTKSYGAEKKIRESLSYQIGSTLVSSTKSKKQLALLPVRLLKIYRESKTNQNNKSITNLEAYDDHKQAEKVKRHLSYKLGVKVTESITSPYKFLTLPFVVAKEVYDFKKKD